MIYSHGVCRLAGRACLGLLLASCAMLAQAQTTLRAVMDSPLRILDPVATTAHVTRNHAYLVFDTLLGIDHDNQPQPQMASWQISADGLRYTFTLRPGLQWHDGQPVRAEDCVASLRRWASRDGSGQRLMAHVARLQATGPDTFELTLARPFGYVLQLLAKPSGIPAFMMPERLAATPGTEQLKEMIGSGPFTFNAAQYQPGVRAVYDRFAGYQPRPEPLDGTAGGKQALVAHVEFVVMPDAQTALNALQAAEVDFFEQVPVDLLPLLQGDPQLHVQPLNRLGFQAIARMNFQQPPFNAPAIRRAALAAIGQQDVLAALVGNPEYYQVCATIWGCHTPLASEQAAYPQLLQHGDPQRARQMLEDAGYDGTPITLLQATDVPVLVAQPVVVAAQLRQAGFKVNLVASDWQSIVARRANAGPVEKGGWNLLFTNWSVAEVWNPLVNPMLNGGGLNGAWFGWPDDPSLDRLRDEFAAAGSPEAQREVAGRIEAHAIDTVSYVPLGQFQVVSAWRNTLHGLGEMPVTAFWGVSKHE